LQTISELAALEMCQSITTEKDPYYINKSEKTSLKQRLLTAMTICDQEFVSKCVFLDFKKYNCENCFKNKNLPLKSEK